MDLDKEQNAIAKGKVLAFLLMSKQPLSLNIVFAAEKLQLEPEQISEALWELSNEGRIDLVLTRAIVTLRNPPAPPENPEPEELLPGEFDDIPPFPHKDNPEQSDSDAFAIAHLSSFDGSPESIAHLKDHPGNPKSTARRKGAK